MDGWTDDRQLDGLGGQVDYGRRMFKFNSLFAAKFCNPMDFVNIEIWVLLSNSWDVKKPGHFSLPSWFIVDFRQPASHCCLMDLKP